MRLTDDTLQFHASILPGGGHVVQRLAPRLPTCYVFQRRGGKLTSERGPCPLYPRGTFPLLKLSHSKCSSRCATCMTSEVGKSYRLPVGRRSLKLCHLAVKLVERYRFLIASLFIIGQRFLQRRSAGETVLDRVGKQLSIPEGVTHPMHQNRIFAVTRVPS